MSCSVAIFHSGVALSPLSLFTLLTSITTHTHVHPLLFSVGSHDFSLDFRPSLALFTPEELHNRTHAPSSFCHFQSTSPGGLRAWLSVCDPEQIEMILHAPHASYAMERENGTFRLVAKSRVFFQYYNSLNIEIRPVHLVIFKTKETASIDYSNAVKVSKSFQKYLKENCQNMHFDNAELLM
ncbi:hypothetical protein PMAYCL1PPCAC_05742, partial [Pristionchus mayeri]